MSKQDKDKNVSGDEPIEEMNAPVDASGDEDASENASANDAKEAKDPLDIALAEVEELKKQMLYKAAEFENFRKRTIAEKTELILNGGQNVIKAVLPVVDDMERAIETAGKVDDIAALEEGWELIAKKLVKVLESLGVKKMNVANADFDTDFHEAVALVPVEDDAKKGKVIDCVQTGYVMNDKVLRHAKVAVGQ